MGKKKPIVSSLGQWAYPGEVTIIPSNSITMKGVGYPVLGVDNLGNSQMMMPGADYTFPGDYVTEIPQMGKGGLTQWFAEEWTDVKTGKPCGRSGKEKGSRPYPACRPKKRVNETTPKTTSEMSSAEKAKFKREKTSGKRIDYNHKRREDGGETWLDQYQFGSERLPIKPEQIVNSKLFRPTFNTEYNSPLLPGGTKEIQEYQKKLNQQYGTFLDEDGIWGEETQKAYQKFKVDKEKGQSNNLKYRPTLSEFKSFYEKIPSYNSGYESIYDVNPNMSAVQEGPLTKERFNQISLLPNENDLINQYRGKTFGSLPVIEGAGLYEGYSPSRIWTGYTPFLPNKKGTSELRKDSSDKSDLHDASYLYFLAPKNEDLTSDYVNNVDISAKDIFDIEGSIVKGVKDPVAAKQLYDFLNKNKTVKETIKNLNLPEYEKFTNDDWRELLEASTLKSGSWTFNKEAPVYWKQWREFGDELLQNPDIIKYAKDNNIDLSQITNVPFNNKNRAKSSSYVNYDEPLYSSQLIEGIMAQRDAKINKRVSGSGTGDGYSVIQDPSKYNFYGYTPIQPGETLDNLKASSARNLYMTRAGVPNDPKLREQILIHTSRFPIEEYVPSKKYGGWLEEYQEGGFRYTSPPRRGFTTSYQQPTRSTSDNTRVVTPNVSDATRAMVADQRAREAAAKRSGVIYAGTPESDYEKAKKAASFVEQSKLADGFATPLDYVLDTVNPTQYVFNATDLVGNQVSAVKNLAQGNFQEAGSDLLEAQMNALSLVPITKAAAPILKPILKQATRYGDDVIQTSKIAGRPALPKYKDVYRAEHAGFNQVATPQDITGRWAANSADEASYYVQNLKDPTTGKTINAFSEQLSPVRIMKQRLPEYKYNRQFAEGMPEEARIISMGPGRLSKTELDQVLGPGATKRFQTNQFSNQDLAAMQTAPFLFNPNEGILDAGIINNLRQGKNTLSGRASVFATQNQAADYLLNQTKSKQNVSSLNKYLPFNTFQMGGMSIPRVNGTKGKGGQTNWLEQYQEGGEEPAPEDIEKMETIEINSRVGNKQVSKRKTDLDREINTGYNIFDKLKNKANRFILNLVASNPAFAQTLIEGTKIADKAVRKVGDKTKDFIYENYRPIEYPTVRGAIYNLYKGSAPPTINPEGKLIPGEEAYRLALGLPTEQNYIIPSKYRPTTSTDPNMSYYTMPDVFDQQALINAYMEQSKGQPGQKVQIKALSPFIKNKNKIDSPDIPFEQTDPLQNFQLSQGSDERGNYISLYDIYDFGAPFDQLIYGSNRKPIEFYDRFYYTTNAQGKPVYKKKYGGWLNKYK